SESSVPVIARILVDMRLFRRDIGQIILATALLQDTIGWIALAAIAGVVRSGRLDAWGIVKPLLGLALLGGFALTLGRRACLALLRRINDHARGDQALLAAVLALTFAGAALSQAAGIHSIVGAFLVGVMLGGLPVVGKRLLHPVEAITT